MTRFAKNLLDWYQTNQRDLPWRRTSDPYRIWISEVMLQQTQVETVIPYYERWLVRYPTLADVAKSSLDEVLKIWEGLGYYSRARNFYRACQEVMERHGGKVPSNPTVFSQLPGVGPYIMGAVQSIAFGHSLPAIDANVKRVVSRLQCIDVAPSQARDQISKFLQRHVPSAKAGDFNQAMMELGATICRSRQPLCTKCPVRTLCQAFRTKSVSHYPVAQRRKIRPHVVVGVGVIWKDNQVLISKRHPKGLLGGLWEFPGGKLEPGESIEACVQREIAEELGIVVEVGSLLCTVPHAYTHFTLEVWCFACRYVEGVVQALGCVEFRWIAMSEISAYAFPGSNHKMFPFLPRTNPFGSASCEVDSGQKKNIAV